jgi:hypothetical protein
MLGDGRRTDETVGTAGTKFSDQEPVLKGMEEFSKAGSSV